MGLRGLYCFPLWKGQVFVVPANFIADYSTMARSFTQPAITSP